MPSSGMFDTTIRVLDKVLDLRTRKLEAISSNIANAETPGYSRIQVDFEDRLRQAVQGLGGGQATTHPNHLPASSGQSIDHLRVDVFREPDTSGIGDRNSVDLDREMVDLSENQIRFEAAVRMLNKKFNMLRFVIQERA